MRVEWIVYESIPKHKSKDIHTSELGVTLYILAC